MRRLAAWAPPLLWLSLIIVATSIPNLDTSAYPNADKIFHLAAYAVLGVLAVRAVHLTWGMGMAAILWTALAGLAVAAADEGHQALVPGRTACAVDFLINAAGYGLGLFLGMLRFKKGRKVSET